MAEGTKKKNHLKEELPNSGYDQTGIQPGVLSRREYQDYWWKNKRKLEKRPLRKQNLKYALYIVMCGR